MAIDNRKQRVLRAIVALYATGGEPVGSGLLAEHFDRAVSSATLRNEMAALTKLGLLEQPHTSAGRVPSAKGYRYYLDNLLEPAPVSASVFAEIDRRFREMDYDPEHLAQEAAKALADLTGYAAAVTTPRSDDMCIAHFEVMQVGRGAGGVLAVTNAGGVRTRTARIESPLERGDVELAAAALNRYLTFRSAADVGFDPFGAVYAPAGAQAQALRPIFSAGYTLLKEAGRSAIYLEGQQNLVRLGCEQSSYCSMLELFSDAQAVRRLIPRSERVTVVLGDELPGHTMPGLCVMARRYHAGGGLTGTISIIGPTRMQYREMIPTLEYFARVLGEHMAGTA